MKKFDLHMHTISTVSDQTFTFDLNVLRNYVNQLSIDCIAITNHNCFDIEQYREISSALSIKVFPGIEIDLEGCHLLLISDGTELHDFSQRCGQVTSEIPTENDYITFGKLQSIFPDLSRYLLIPHFDKKPSASKSTLRKLSPFISAGEVSSPKKFTYCIKDEASLTPVLFSDLRMKNGLEKFPTRQTYIDVGEISLSSVKNSLRDKNKVFLSLDDGHKFFNALDTGLKLSTGLNVILGERSTGKSYTLDRLESEYENTKYIRQFSLLERDQADDIRKFNESLSSRQSILTRDYLTDIQSVVDDIINVDVDHDERSVDSYIKSLIKNAKEAEKADSYSKAQLFNESNYSIGGESNLKSLIDATVKLIENTEYREIIDRNISITALKKLAVELMENHIKETSTRLKKQFVNDVVDSIKSELRIHTAATPIDELDLYQILLDRKKVDKFNKLINIAKSEHEILRKEIQGYQIVSTRRGFTGAQELKKLSGKMYSFSSAYNLYKNPYKYLKELSKTVGLDEAELYKFFVKIEYKILNKYGSEVSGGERSEFRLLQEINDAQQYDMLLIDEPESSFDNIFLMNKVNTLIKSISKNMPVVLVTHNSTVGASIRPDYVLVTKKALENDQLVFNIYSGHPSDKELTGLDGSKIRNHDAMLNCLEAGETAYYERGNSYETLKN